MLPHLQKDPFGKPSTGLPGKLFYLSNLIGLENTTDKVDSPNSPYEEIKFTVPSNKLEKPKRNRSAFIIFSSEVKLYKKLYLFLKDAH